MRGVLGGGSGRQQQRGGRKYGLELGVGWAVEYGKVDRKVWTRVTGRGRNSKILDRGGIEGMLGIEDERGAQRGIFTHTSQSAFEFQLLLVPDEPKVGRLGNCTDPDPDYVPIWPVLLLACDLCVPVPVLPSQLGLPIAPPKSQRSDLL